MKNITVRGVSLGRICMGAADFGYKVSENDAFRIIDIFRENGGNLIDTANVYCRWLDGDNGSEKLLGRYLKARGKNCVHIATKGGHYEFSDPTKSRVTEEDVRKDVEMSLSALGIDTIDFYWLHRDNTSLSIEEILYFCEKLKKEGKILNYGGSNFTTARMREAKKKSEENGFSGFFGYSNSFSAANENFDPAADKTLVHADREQLAFLESTETPLFAYSAGARGYFAKKLKDGDRFDRWRYPAFNNKENDRRFEILKNAAQNTGHSISACAMSALLGLSVKVVPIFSVSSEEHLAEILDGESFVLDENVVESLDLYGK